MEHNNNQELKNFKPVIPILITIAMANNKIKIMVLIIMQTIIIIIKSLIPNQHKNK